MCGTFHGDTDQTCMFFRYDELISGLLCDTGGDVPRPPASTLREWRRRRQTDCQREGLISYFPFGGEYICPAGLRV